MNGISFESQNEELSHSQHHSSLENELAREQAKVIKKLKHVVNSLKQQNEELKQSKDENSGEKVHALEAQVTSLKSEKESLSHLIYGLRGCVDQTSLVMERSQARFVRLHDQLSSTRDSLSTSQLYLNPPPDVMSVQELYQENEELRNTVDFIRSHLDVRRSSLSSSPVPPSASSLHASHGFHASRSLSPSRHRPTTLDGVHENDMLTLENKDLRERLRLAEKKLRSAQIVKRRYEQALERANSIIDQRNVQPAESEPSLPAISKQQLSALMSEMKAVEDERDQYRAECMRLNESERTALEECERVHTICHELQALLDTTTAALSERSSAYDSSTHQILELEAKLEEVSAQRDMLQSHVSQLNTSPSGSPVPQMAPQPTTNMGETDVRRYSELVRRLESQFRNSQIQLESITSEKHRLEGLYRAIQSECAELRNSMSRYEATNRDLRSQLSDREGRVQALESAKSLLSNAMFKTEQENKQLLWQLKSIQGADERLGKTLEQLHQLQSQNLSQGEALRDSRSEASRLASQLQASQASLHSLISERAVVFAELRNISSTCGELADLVA